MTRAEFVIMGQPRPAGSKRHIGNGVVIDSSGEKGRNWRASIQAVAREQFTGELLRGPLVVYMTFFAPRPKSHYGSGRNSGRLKDDAPQYPTGRPDVLKLARAVEDALTGIVWADDGQIVDEILAKRYGEPARCVVSIHSSSRVQVKEPA